MLKIYCRFEKKLLSHPVFFSFSLAGTGRPAFLRAGQKFLPCPGVDSTNTLTHNGFFGNPSCRTNPKRMGMTGSTRKKNFERLQFSGINWKVAQRAGQTSGYDRKVATEVLLDKESSRQLIATNQRFHRDSPEN